MRRLLPFAAVVILTGLLCWSMGWWRGYREGHEAGAASTRTPLIEEGRVRWVETDRDTLDSGLIIYEVRDLVWNQRCIFLARDGEPIQAVVIDPR